MVLAQDAIIFYSLHLASLPLSLTLIIAYFKRFPTISILSITSFLLSLNFVLTGVLNINDFIIINNDNNGSGVGGCGGDAGTINCLITGTITMYFTCSLAVWFICIEIEIWLKLRQKNQQQQQQQHDIEINNRNNDDDDDNDDDNNNNNKINNKILIICNIIGWGFPLVLTTTFVLVTRYLNIYGFVPWKFHYFISTPVIPFFYFIITAIALAIIILSVKNLFSMINYYKSWNNNNNINISTMEIIDRAIICGLIISVPLLVISASRLIPFLQNKGLIYDDTWPEFMMTAIPFISFITLGTTSAIRRQFFISIISLIPCKIRNGGDGNSIRNYNNINNNLNNIFPRLSTSSPKTPSSVLTKTPKTPNSMTFPSSFNNHDYNYNRNSNYDNYNDHNNPLTMVTSTFSNRVNATTDPFINRRKQPPLQLNIHQNNRNGGSSSSNNNNNSRVDSTSKRIDKNTISKRDHDNSSLLARAMSGKSILKLIDDVDDELKERNEKLRALLKIDDSDDNDDDNNNNSLRHRLRRRRRRRLNQFSLSSSISSSSFSSASSRNNGNKRPNFFTFFFEKQPKSEQTIDLQHTHNPNNNNNNNNNINTNHDKRQRALKSHNNNFSSSSGSKSNNNNNTTTTSTNATFPNNNNNNGAMKILTEGTTFKIVDNSRQSSPEAIIQIPTINITKVPDINREDNDNQEIILGIPTNKSNLVYSPLMAPPPHLTASAINNNNNNNNNSSSSSSQLIIDRPPSFYFMNDENAFGKSRTSSRNSGNRTSIRTISNSSQRYNSQYSDKYSLYSNDDNRNSFRSTSSFISNNSNGNNLPSTPSFGPPKRIQSSLRIQVNINDTDNQLSSTPTSLTPLANIFNGNKSKNK